MHRGPTEKPTRIDVEPEPVLDGHPGDVRRRDADTERVVEAFQRYLGSAAVSAIPIAGGIALFGLVLMSWPARRATAAADADELVAPAPEHA
jgi:hypothetical protein